MMKYAIFCAGKVGKGAYHVLKSQGHEIVCFIDNYSDKKEIGEIPLYKLEDFLNKNIIAKIIIACSDGVVQVIINQLRSVGIKEYDVFPAKEIYSREKLVSYSNPHDLEDVILYNVFKNESDIFYIDVGANDPFIFSVTKLLYDSLNASGINIEPQKAEFDALVDKRKRDINLRVGLGNKKDTMKLFLSGGLSTLCSDSDSIHEKTKYEEIEIDTLENICLNYVEQNKEISFLKIDVEGFEKQVLEGANFKKWRPKVIVMESTKPRTMDFCYEDWEYILVENHDHFVYTYGVNRYYVADEYSYLDKRFEAMDVLKQKYCIYTLNLED